MPDFASSLPRFHGARRRLGRAAVIAALAAWAPVRARADTGDAPPYVAMREPGATWTYDVERELRWGIDGQEVPDVAERGRVACRVERVRRLGAATVVSIACELLAGAAPGLEGSAGLVALAGDWAFTSRGLWHARTPVSSTAAVVESTRGAADMPARPRAGAPPSPKTAPAAYAYQLRSGDRWCTDSAWVEPIASGERLVCFADGVIGSIIIGRESYGEGGSRSTTTITRVR